jgi:hypothetical protein
MATLEKQLVDALKADAILAVSVNQRIFLENAPANTERPYLVLVENTSERSQTTCSDITEEFTILVELVGSDAGSLKDARERLVEILESDMVGTLTFDGGRVMACSVLSSILELRQESEQRQSWVQSLDVSLALQRTVR